MIKAQANEHYEADQYEEVIKCYQQMIDKCDGGDHAKLADSYYMCDKLDLAIRHWKIATEKRADEFIFFYNLGQVIQTQNIDLQEAEAAYKQSLKLNAEYEESWYNLGMV